MNKWRARCNGDYAWGVFSLVGKKDPDVVGLEDYGEK